MEAGKEAYRATRAWMAFTLEGFELGTGTAKDLMDGLAAFVKARFTLLQLTYDYNTAVAHLSVASGTELQPELAELNVW